MRDGSAHGGESGLCLDMRCVSLLVEESHRRRLHERGCNMEIPARVVASTMKKRGLDLTSHGGREDNGAWWRRVKEAGTRRDGLIGSDGVQQGDMAMVMLAWGGLSAK